MDILKTIAEEFPQRSVVIVGDLVADQFLHGTISRVSREAPVFILRHDSTATLPGAAANAAANVAALGGGARLVGIVGADPNGDALLAQLAKFGVAATHIVRSSRHQTTTKLRVLAGQHYAARQQVIRVDYENTVPFDAGIKDELRQNLRAAASDADAIIISDYGCGAVFPEVFEDAKATALERQIPIIVDSRYSLGLFAGATAATPNREEVENTLGKDFTTDDCAALRERLGLRSLLVTNGSEGMTLFEDSRSPRVLAAVGLAEAVDVTGAGDTVIASFALALASGMTFADAAEISNHAGGIVVMKKGTSTVSAAELLNSLAGVDRTATTNAA